MSGPSGPRVRATPRPSGHVSGPPGHPATSPGCWAACPGCPGRPGHLSGLLGHMSGMSGLSLSGPQVRAVRATCVGAVQENCIVACRPSYALPETIKVRQNSRTFCAFLDIRKAFDVAWREGALLKPHRAGISAACGIWSSISFQTAQQSALMTVSPNRGMLRPKSCRGLFFQVSFLT